MVRFDAASLLSTSSQAGEPSPKTPRRRRSQRDGATVVPGSALNNIVFPAWARPGSETVVASDRAAYEASGARNFAAEACFSAGAGLALLDQILRENPPFAGALRQRLALRAAIASASILRLREDEGGLRDAEHLAAPGADPGPARQIETSPAGRLHRLWRAFAAGSARLDDDGFSLALRLLDAPRAIDADRLAATLHDFAGKERNPLAASVLAASLVANAFPEASRREAEILALWAADLVLSVRLGWERPVPLVATKILDPSLRRGVNGKRPRPGDPQWSETMARAYALAACDAHALAADLARRSHKLLTTRPKLRAKGAGRVIELLLDDDAVTPARAARMAGLSDRAARRLFDRLVMQGVVRELSGRPSFRLYGL